MYRNHNLDLLNLRFQKNTMSLFETVHKKVVLKLSFLPQLKKFWDYTKVTNILFHKASLLVCKN